MNYRVYRQGTDLGLHTLEELRRRRTIGEFNGEEYVQLEGRLDWQPLDRVLQFGYQTSASPSVSTFGKSSDGPIVWIAITVSVVAFLVLFFMGMRMATSFRQSIRNTVPNSREPNLALTLAATSPVKWATNGLTQADVEKRNAQMRKEEWEDGYWQRGNRNAKSDAEATRFFLLFNERCEDKVPPEDVSLEMECNKLAADTNCIDPLLLTIAGINSLNKQDIADRLERALKAYPASKHRAAPQFYACASLAGTERRDMDHSEPIETSALQAFTKCFNDGSFSASNQQDIAEILVNDWGSMLFHAHGPEICDIVKKAGPDYKWLALTLAGENEINAAWKSRGVGYANDVSEVGWEGFWTNLQSARTNLTAAWELHPEWPMAPCRMMTVCLGNSDITEIRLWFDRTVLYRMDYPGAWKEMRWALRPRWHGDVNAMLEFGRVEAGTKRYDTDVPRMFFDSVADIENERNLPVGCHIYGREDVWPVFQSLYEGYITNVSQAPNADGWRSSYAVVAYLGGRYDVARKQLEALNWQPHPHNLTGWCVDLSEMASEVAARTGTLGKEITVAENLRDQKKIDDALKKYGELQNADSDTRTKQFIQTRTSELSIEQKLQKGEWVDWLPAKAMDPGWHAHFGEAAVLPDGTLEVKSGIKGHMIYSLARVGSNFEISGTVENVSSDNGSFQSGIVMGVPDYYAFNWFGFRIKHNNDEGDLVTFSRHWVQKQILQYVQLNPGTNTFDLIYKNGAVTASINGQLTIQNAKPPEQIGVPNDSFLVGFGAFNRDTDSVIRYSKVRLRQLPLQ